MALRPLCNSAPRLPLQRPRYSDAGNYDGALECGPLDTDDYCLAGLTYYCPGGKACFGRTGREILNALTYQGYDKSESQVGWRLLVLLYYILLFKLISVMRLYMKAVVASPNATKLVKSGTKKNIKV